MVLLEEEKTIFWYSKVSNKLKEVRKLVRMNKKHVKLSIAEDIKQSYIIIFWIVNR